MSELRVLSVRQPAGLCLSCLAARRHDPAVVDELLSGDQEADLGVVDQQAGFCDHGAAALTASPNRASRGPTQLIHARDGHPVITRYL